MGMDQRAPASAYSSPSAYTPVPAYQMRGVSSSSQATQAMCVARFPTTRCRLLILDLFSG